MITHPAGPGGDPHSPFVVDHSVSLTPFHVCSPRFPQGNHQEYGVTAILDDLPLHR